MSTTSRSVVAKWGTSSGSGGGGAAAVSGVRMGCRGKVKEERM